MESSDKQTLTTSSMNETFLKIASLLNSGNNNKDPENPTPELNTKERLLKMMQLVRLYSTIKICKEDKLPIEMIDGLYIGSIGGATNKDALLENKITHIVVAASGLKANFPNDFTYIHFNLLDSETEDIKKYFKESGQFIDNAIKNGGRVMVHCLAGISRSSTIILSYLIKYKQMKLDDALKMIKSKREKINPNPGFIKQLKEYESECKV